jgi:hypothetical protein
MVICKNFPHEKPKEATMAEVTLFKTGENYNEDVHAYYNGKGIYLTHQSGIESDENGFGRKDFQIALHPKEAVELIEELKKAVNDTVLDIKLTLNEGNA